MRLPAFPPQLIPDAIEHRLTKVRLERTDPPRLEILDSFEGLSQGVLDEIVRVSDITRPLGQSASGPSLKGLEMTGEEAFQRLLVTRAGPLNQMKG
jgi:hypothetical protein